VLHIKQELHTIPENLNSPPILQTVYTEVLWNGVQMTIIYITILTEDLLNGVYRTIIYITILTEDSWNGVHRTIIL
jgi:hypothetical protein